MLAIAEIPVVPLQAMDKMVQSPKVQARSPNEIVATEPYEGGSPESTKIGGHASDDSPIKGHVNGDASASSDTSPKNLSVQTPCRCEELSKRVAYSASGVSPTKAAAASPDIDETATAISDAATQLETEREYCTEDPQYVDRFDTCHHGDVVRYFFTSDTRHRPLSPVQEHGCVNLQLHEESDLFIKTKGADSTLYVFEVHSGILAASSPVFNRMVYSTHTRGNKEEWIWDLNEDPIGLRVMFSILHHHVQVAMFRHNPRPRQIFNVLSVLAKYGVSDRVFYPYAKGWTYTFREGASANQAALQAHEMLFVACKLGDLMSFKKYVRQVAQQVELSEDNTILHDGQELQDVVAVSDQVVQTIKDTRIKEIERLLAVFKDAYDFLIDNKKANKPKYCKSADHHADCHQKLLGSLLSNLVYKQLFPFSDLNGFKGSVCNLIVDMGTMEIRGLYLPGLEPHRQRHGQCRLDVEATLREVAQSEVEVPLCEEMLEELFLTSKRTGIFHSEKAEFKLHKAQMGDIIHLYHPEFSSHVRGWEQQAGDTDTESSFSDEE